MKKIIAALWLLIMCVAAIAVGPTVHTVLDFKNETPSATDRFANGMRIVAEPEEIGFTELVQTRVEREPEGLSIQLVDSSVVLSWTEVAGATAYKVYSAQYPEGPFSEDLSGTFLDASWTAALSQDRLFFQVTALTEGSPNEMIFVPSGTFTMGFDAASFYPDSYPPHSVSLNSFYIGKYHVTQAEYAAIMGSNPAADYGVGDNYPIYNVSWYSAIKYCNLRSMAEGLTPVYRIYGLTHPLAWGTVPSIYNPGNIAAWNAATADFSANGYRLPTEAEWEYAARGATNIPDYAYSGSDVLNLVGWYNMNNTPDGVKPVGLKLPNGLGIYDMSGNLTEWCWDWKGAYSSDAVTNPTGPASPSLLIRIVRGGAWAFYDYGSQVYYRSGQNASNTDQYIGFRISRSGL
jgi:formylglycine-generating enzyme required for sulfatase activity